MFIAARLIWRFLRMRVLSGPSNPFLSAFSGAFKALGYTVASPFLLIALLGALLVVAIDFAIFRTRDMLLGHPEPKGLWEF
jgi:hypothetical protein